MSAVVNPGYTLNGCERALLVSQMESLISPLDFRGGFMAVDTKEQSAKAEVGFITVVLPLEQKTALAALAADRDRSLSAEARRAIGEHLKACGR